MGKNTVPRRQIAKAIAKLEEEIDKALQKQIEYQSKISELEDEIQRLNNVAINLREQLDDLGGPLE